MEKNNYNYELVQDQYPHFYLAQGRDHCCSMHFHRKVELLYVTKGTKRVIVNNAPYVLQQDNLCIIDSYSLHYYEPSDGEQTVVTLTTASCENFFKHRSNKTLCGNVIDDRDYCRTRVRPYLDNLFDYAKMDAYSVQANVDMLLSGICARIGLKNRRSRSRSKTWTPSSRTSKKITIKICPFRRWRRTSGTANTIFRACSTTSFTRASTTI